ncbi:unnamed protein product [Bursaphelenchus okinawaensis]|uniref:Uncharacterized protein n=1 Tax=Bursaphelenchus okinawaensis TaxID=465554 RepID=A0A811KZI5_9BILA|nr:unnamed protein product [Bursaphelenchus okinawaensis]CAG9114219.1 unnamed protein product [Bursaphelenchus okinawaensis]
MKCCTILLLLPYIVYADYTAAVNQFKSLVTDDLTDNFISSAVNTTYVGVQKGWTYKKVSSEVYNSVENQLSDQSAFYSAAISFYSDVSDLDTFMDEALAGLKPILSKLYFKLLKKKPSSETAYAKQVKKLMTKKVIKKCFAGVKGKVKSSDWNYMVEDFYNLIKFSQYGISKN